MSVYSATTLPQVYTNRRWRPTANQLSPTSARRPGDLRGRSSTEPQRDTFEPVFLELHYYWLRLESTGCSPTRCSNARKKSADARDVLRMVVKVRMTPRVLASSSVQVLGYPTALLFGVKPNDASTFATIDGVLALVALLAGGSRGQRGSTRSLSCATNEAWLVFPAWTRVLQYFSKANTNALSNATKGRVT